MKYFGAEPPWRGELFSNSLGHWVWVSQSKDAWFDTPGHWVWRPPRSTMARLGITLARTYQRSINSMLNEQILLRELSGEFFGGMALTVPTA